MGEKRKILKKIFGWVILLIASVIIGGLVFAWIKIPDFLKNKASEFTEQKSGGLYHLTIKNIDIDIFPVAINLQGVEVMPDEEATLIAKESGSEKTIYSFSSEAIRIEKIDLRSIWKNRNFHCRRIFISEPDIEISGKELFQSDSVSSADEIVAGIRPLFSNYLKQLTIDRIEFSDANFGISIGAGAPIQRSQTEKMLLEVRGFRTDSAMIFRNARFFETDDVLVKMQGFKNNMGDSLHVTTIDTLEYSLKSTDIRAVGFHLFPLYSTPEKNLFNVKVPEVYVKSKSITHFALDDSLKIRFLEFNNPEIRFYHKKNPEQFNIEKLNDFNLYTLVQNQFKKMEVDSFLLKSANLEIFRQPDTVNFQQQFRSIDIKLTGFALDSTSAQNRNKLFHADNLEMHVGGYRLRLNDNQHEFSADSLFVSTFTNRLGINKIKINPANPLKFNARTEVNINCSELNIEDVDLKRLYYTRRLPTTKIEIVRPDVTLQYHLEKQKQNKQKETGLLYELISDYLRGVYSNLVFIENGKLSIQNRQNQKVQGYFETNFTFSLTDFSLDSTSIQRTDKFFYATNFDLDFSNYNMRLVDDLHKLEMEHATVSSLNQKVAITGLKLQPISDNVTLQTMRQYNRSEIYNIRFPGITLNGVDLNNAFFEKKLKIKNFTVNNPEIYFENFGTIRANRKEIDLNEFYDLIFNYIEDFDIDLFSIPDGEITWVNHTRKGKTTSLDNEFSATLFNFRLNKDEVKKERLFFSDNFDISIKDQLFELSDSVHILKAGEIQLSSVNSTLSIKNGLLYPIITSGKYKSLPTTFQVTIPELKISNLNFAEAYYSQNPHLGKLTIYAPKFQIYNQKGKSKSLDLSKYKFPLPKFIHSLKLDEFKITNAGVVTYETKGIDNSAQGSFNFDLTLPGMTIQNNDNQAFIKSDNIQLQLNDFRVPVGESHGMTANKVIFNRQQKSIRINDLKVESFSSHKKENSFNIHAPEISFYDFDLRDALTKNQFNFSQITIASPSVDIAINKKPDKDTVEFLQTLDLFPYIEPYLDQVKINDLRLTDANVNFNWLQKKLFDNKVNLEFKNILIAENQPPASILNSEEFEISTSNLKTKSGNGLYEYTAGTLSYNSEKHRVLLTDIKVNPLVEKRQFPILNGFQTDVVNAQIDFAEMQGIDDKKWLKENVLDASMLKVGPSNITIFRNKRYPFNQGQRPPWPQDLLKEIQYPFVFDSILLMPSQINYSELTAISDKPGILEFNDLTFTGGKISNMKEVITINNLLTINAQAKLYGEALLKSRFRFDMMSTDYYHTATGSLQAMNLSLINNMLTRSAPMKIENGKLNRFDFEMTLNEKHSEGLLYFGYDDLKIAVIDYSNSNEKQKARLASFWANKMILNSKNPKSGILEPVSIHYNRDEKRSVINYWWKSLYSSVKEVLGIEPKEE